MFMVSVYVGTTVLFGTVSSVIVLDEFKDLEQWRMGMFWVSWAVVCLGIYILFRTELTKFLAKRDAEAAEGQASEALQKGQDAGEHYNPLSDGSGFQHYFYSLDPDDRWAAILRMPDGQLAQTCAEVGIASTDPTRQGMLQALGDFLRDHNHPKAASVSTANPPAQSQPQPQQPQQPQQYGLDSDGTPFIHETDRPQHAQLNDSPQPQIHSGLDTDGTPLIRGKEWPQQQQHHHHPDTNLWHAARQGVVAQMPTTHVVDVVAHAAAWERHASVEHENHPYWHNAITGETTWHPPIITTHSTSWLPPRGNAQVVSEPHSDSERRTIPNSSATTLFL